MRAFLLTTAAAVAFLIAPAAAQRQAPTPEQRIERLERQLRQMQRQVFPRGAPADTAGFSDEPAASQSSVRNLDDRLSALERQLADVLRQSEENGHRATQMQTELERLRTDQEQRIAALEAAARAAPAGTAAPAPGPSVTALPPAAAPVQSATPGRTPSPAPAGQDAAELAYDEGYQHWRAGRYDDAIRSLRALASTYPRHRRASWANNLIGRSLLDKGEARAAAEALLANYRGNPRGERAADSLYYLGQALMKLGQPGQACKAYAELDDVYGAKMRDELKGLLPQAKTQANCS
jgi:TolA-binding protein